MQGTTLETVKSLCSEAFGVPVDEIVGPSRRRRVVDARACCCYVTRHLSQDSYEDVGRRFGIDKSSARWGCLRIHREVQDKGPLEPLVRKVGDHFGIDLDDPLPAATRAAVPVADKPNSIRRGPFDPEEQRDIERAIADGRFTRIDPGQYVPIEERLGRSFVPFTGRRAR